MGDRLKRKKCEGEAEEKNYKGVLILLPEKLCFFVMNSCLETLSKQCLSAHYFMFPSLLKFSCEYLYVQLFSLIRMSLVFLGF